MQLLYQGYSPIHWIYNDSYVPYGVKLEQMSISGLIIALGMLVDNAIVVSDAIQFHVDEGMENFKAALAVQKK